MKEEFYNMNIDEYRDIYKNFYLKCLKYREDLLKMWETQKFSTLEPLE